MPKVSRNSSSTRLKERDKTDSLSLSRLFPQSSSGAPFDFQSRTRLIFGADSIQRIGELSRELGARRVLLVTDSGIVAAGHADLVRQILETARLKIAVYDGVRENPSTRDVSECVAVAKKFKTDFLIGLGGGSSMDTAKGCNFILTNGGDMKDYWGMGKAKKPMLPMIAVPTTAGTGSEMQSAALISDEVTHQKMACLDHKAAARIAILDPELTLSQPRRVTACTGIDAIAHAVESAVTKKRNPLSLMFAHKAFELCSTSFGKILREPLDVEARGKMLLGAAFAGLAIENSMLGAAHSAANPLTAHFGVVHGEAVGLMLPHVVAFNAKDPVAADAYFQMGRMNAASLVKFLRSLLKIAELPEKLSETGVKRTKLLTLAEEAAQQWTAGFNPRPIGKADFLKLYEAAF
ncbi:MAG: iron-containing alcohol dehydrogenase [Verrucomicrobia bacterium]|nr:iron-containing alcohol dehydrogenase [Verrucomicrobiota bacterium]